MVFHPWDWLHSAPNDAGFHHVDDLAGPERFHREDSSFLSIGSKGCVGHAATHEHCFDRPTLKRRWLHNSEAASSAFQLRAPRSRAAAASFLDWPVSGTNLAHRGARVNGEALDFLPPLQSSASFPVPRARSSTSFLSIQERLTDFVQKAPPAALVPLHAASIVLAVPGHVAFELGEGYAFGFKKGFALAFAGKTLGAGISFGIGRSGYGCLGELREYLKRQVEQWSTARQVAKAVNRGGAFSVLVVRVAPLPCVVKNYALALLTDIPFSVYIAASMLGLAPTTAAHVFAGAVATSGLQLVGGHHTPMQVFAIVSPLAFGALLTLSAGYYVHRYILHAEDSEDGLRVTAQKVEHAY